MARKETEANSCVNCCNRGSIRNSSPRYVCSRWIIQALRNHRSLIHFHNQEIFNVKCQQQTSALVSAISCNRKAILDNFKTSKVKKDMYFRQMLPTFDRLPCPNDLHRIDFNSRHYQFEKELFKIASGLSVRGRATEWISLLMIIIDQEEAIPYFETSVW